MAVQTVAAAVKPKRKRR